MGTDDLLQNDNDIIIENMTLIMMINVPINTTMPKIIENITYNPCVFKSYGQSCKYSKCTLFRYLHDVLFTEKLLIDLKCN